MTVDHSDDKEQGPRTRMLWPLSLALLLFIGASLSRARGADLTLSRTLLILASSFAVFLVGGLIVYIVERVRG